MPPQSTASSKKFGSRPQAESTQSPQARGGDLDGRLDVVIDHVEATGSLMVPLAALLIDLAEKQRARKALTERARAAVAAKGKRAGASRVRRKEKAAAVAADTGD